MALAVVGLGISTYFTGVAYRWIRPDTRWIPAFCRMGERTCASIVFTPRARVFGLPNSVLGQVFYVALLAGLPLGLLDQPALFMLYLGASLAPVLLAAVHHARAVRALLHHARDQHGHPSAADTADAGVAGWAPPPSIRRRSASMRPYSAQRFQTRLAISVRCTAFRPK
ncbi:MAG: hypothetical protein J4F30_07965 [Acidobacteria bacterium]|nr:hypothetical protein [Acidobacteriota bacterium]